MDRSIHYVLCTVFILYSVWLANLRARIHLILTQSNIEIPQSLTCRSRTGKIVVLSATKVDLPRPRSMGLGGVAGCSRLRVETYGMDDGGTKTTGSQLSWRDACGTCGVDAQRRWKSQRAWRMTTLPMMGKNVKNA